jgi:hypothetical protein
MTPEQKKEVEFCLFDFIKRVASGSYTFESQKQQQAQVEALPLLVREIRLLNGTKMRGR